ncbi:RNA polymerase subunit sigma-70 [Alkalibacter rhizosphaerae]|uniref:RNA polymerase subunit sigma-70 n=1 Tax=Alkalibacter rhizosphaerae TaxID=2815577 RepID=A0A974XGP7_9FIRM|nr:RNA polymerase subunit sigma-70 [Alkalibacter rhizosphaerae]QSX09552.1 RNA polymerase subunit sigma-70 [Alkalibacter rhizosphaerae]
MTDFQKQQIREFRIRGVGYRAISSITGLSRDIVRNYCKAYGLDGFARDLNINIKEKIDKQEACLSCGKDLKQPATGRKRKFCSDDCRRDWWQRHPDSIKRNEETIFEYTCAYCGQEFKVYAQKSRKYCSHECYIRDRYWWKEEGRRPYVGPFENEEVHNE